MDHEKKNSITFHNLILFILLIAMIVGGVGVLREELKSRRQREEQERLASLASQTTEVQTEPETMTEPETEPPYVSPIDFAALWEINPDVVGWIRIPGTRIDYPVLYSGENDTYLHTDIEGRESVYGAIYLEGDSEPDFTGWNHPIYGHHMKDGSMFKDVVKFKEEKFFREHQYFELYTPERTIHLKAVSCYYSGADGIVRKTDFRSQEEFDAWLAERLEPCKFAELPETSVPAVYTLVTCSYETDNARTLLFAVEVDEAGNIITSGETAKNITDK